jgi:hypothetical protein
VPFRFDGIANPTDGCNREWPLFPQQVGNDGDGLKGGMEEGQWVRFIIITSSPPKMNVTSTLTRWQAM